MIPSSTLYTILKTIKSITELDDHTIRISLSQPNYFAVYEIGNLFALPANALPEGNGPLALLLSGALQASGSFTLHRFVQGAEVELQHAPTAAAGKVVTLSGVQGQNVFGSSIGGSQLQIFSQPLSYNGQRIENATFSVQIHDGLVGPYGTLLPAVLIQGSYSYFGIYKANLNLDNQALSVGDHTVTTELYAQLPSGALLQFDQQDLVLHPPQLLWQITVYLLAVAAVGLAVYSHIRVTGEGAPRRRVRRVRGTRPRRARRRK
jgi:hypothetical protein